MTTNEILNAVRRKALEVSTDIISDVTLLLYANQAYMDVYKRIYVNSDITSTTLALTGGAVAVPAGLGTLYGDAVDSAGNLYPEVPIEDFHRRTLGRMVTIEAGFIKAYPVDTSSLTVRYWPKPDALVADSTPSIDEFFHEPIIYGTLARVFEELQDEELSNHYRSRFNTDMAERAAVQSAYEETNQRGAVMFTDQNLIGGFGGFTF